MKTITKLLTLVCLMIYLSSCGQVSQHQGSKEIESNNAVEVSDNLIVINRTTKSGDTILTDGISNLETTQEYIDEVIQCKKDVIVSGNIVAYDKASIFSLGYPDTNATDVFGYAILMANRYGCVRANIDIYLVSGGIPPKNEKLDVRTDHLAVYYLVRGYEKGGERNLDYWIANEFGDKTPPHSSHFLTEIIKEDKKDDAERQLKPYSYDYEMKKGANPELKITPEIFDKLVELKEKIRKGDVAAYKEAYDISVRNRVTYIDFLVYSMLMANRYNHIPAHVHTYLILSTFSKNRANWDYTSKNLAYYYLLRAKELGQNKEVNSLVSQVFGKNVPHSSHYLKEIIKEDARQDAKRGKAK